MVVSDSDWFMMLDRNTNGWEIAEQAVKKAGGGATAVLNMTPERGGRAAARLQSIGWTVEYVPTMSDLLTFARRFSRRTYEVR